MSIILDAKLYSLYFNMVKGYLSVIDKSKGSPEIYRSLQDDVSRLDESQKLVEYMDQNVELKQKVSKLITPLDPQAFRNVLLDKFIVRFVQFYIKENNLTFDEDKLANLFCDLENYLEGRAQFHYSAPLFFFKQEEDNIVINDITIQCINDDEKVLTQKYGWFIPVSYGMQSPNMPLSIMRFQDTQYDLEGKKEMFLQFVEILNLFTDQQPVQLLFVECKTPLFYPVESSSAMEVINARGYRPFVSVLTSEKRKSLLEFIKAFERISNLEIKSRLRFAIRRYNYAKISRIQEDNLVDFVICLESLFGDSTPELKYKFSLRIALLHGKDLNHGKLLKELFGLFYDARSQVVHGSNDKFQKTIRKIEDKDNNWINMLTTIAKDSIIYFVNLTDSKIENIIQQIDDSIFDDNKRQEIRIKAGLSLFTKNQNK